MYFLLAYFIEKVIDDYLFFICQTLLRKLKKALNPNVFGSVMDLNILICVGHIYSFPLFYFIRSHIFYYFHNCQVFFLLFLLMLFWVFFYVFLVSLNLDHLTISYRCINRFPLNIIKKT